MNEAGSPTEPTKGGTPNEERFIGQTWKRSWRGFPWPAPPIAVPPYVCRQAVGPTMPAGKCPPGYSRCAAHVARCGFRVRPRARRCSPRWVWPPTCAAPRRDACGCAGWRRARAGRPRTRPLVHHHDGRRDEVEPDAGLAPPLPLRRAVHDHAPHFRGAAHHPQPLARAGIAAHRHDPPFAQGFEPAAPRRFVSEKHRAETGEAGAPPPGFLMRVLQRHKRDVVLITEHKRQRPRQVQAAKVERADHQ